MEARMLSLFDDEDFLPQEKPKPAKPKKSPAKQESTAAATDEAKDGQEATAATPEPAPQEPETTGTTTGATDRPVAASPDTATVAGTTDEPAEEPEATMPEVEHTEAMPETPEPAEDPAETLEATDPETMPETVLEEQEATPESILPEEQHGITEEPAPPAITVTPVQAMATTASADEELNRQILSELIYSDYTALIHKEYPFDLKHAEVVKKDREVKVPDPARKPMIPVQETQAEPEMEEEADEEPAAPLPEWDLDKRYYTIGEVAQLFKVNTSHIRFWTNEFKLRPRTTRKGDRLYSPEDIGQLRLIHHLVKEKKHTIKGAKEKLKAGKEAVGQKLDLKDSLSSLKEMLIRIKEQL